MNKEIESVIFSNVGNRLTQELAMGMVMSLAQVVHQAVQAERQAAVDAAASGSAESEGGGKAVPSAPADVDGEATAIVEPAYQRKPAPMRRARGTPVGPEPATKAKAKKARQ